MTLSTADYTVELINDLTGYKPGSADNSACYDKAYALPREGISSAHGVRISRESRQIASAIVLAGGGGTGIHPYSALLHSEALLLAVGQFVVSLAIPSLDLRWFTRTDECTCFGIHPIPGTSDFISHGEISIARVTAAGDIVWSGSGKDIFTGGLTVLSGEVRVADFEDGLHSFDLLTGSARLLSPE